MAADPTRLDCLNKCFRYLLSARSREDLDARLHTLRTDILPKVLPGGLLMQNEYYEYLVPSPGCVNFTA